jgi:hypothetical protein
MPLAARGNLDRIICHGFVFLIFCLLVVNILSDEYFVEDELEFSLVARVLLKLESLGFVMVRVMLGLGFQSLLLKFYRRMAISKLSGSISVLVKLTNVDFKSLVSSLLNRHPSLGGTQLP